MEILPSIAFTLCGLYMLYATILVEYTKIFRRNIMEFDCICVGLYRRGGKDGTYSGIWRYIYNGAEMTYRPSITTCFGLPSVGDVSKIGIDTNTGKIIYVKKSIKNKISHIIFDSILIFIGLLIGYAVVIG